MKTIETISVLQKISSEWKKSERVALVPTMGALHEGHLELVRRAKSLADHVIVSIFVNPLQFGPGEDFDRYPRTLEADCEKLRREPTDLVFAPTPREMYPEGFSTTVKVGALQNTLCGRSRPGHFDGVATVCLKLFQAALPDVAVFGEKDFQQLRILEQIVRDLNLPLEINRHPIVREFDGLAMSSRNRYLNSEERIQAREFAAILAAAAKEAKGKTVAEIQQSIKSSLEQCRVQVDYIEIALEKDLVPLSGAEPVDALAGGRLFAAVKVGTTRLIDNLPLKV